MSPQATQYLFTIHYYLLLPPLGPCSIWSEDLFLYGKGVNMKKILKFIPLGAAVLLLAVTGLFCGAVLRAGLLPGLWTALLFGGLFLLDGLLIFLCARTEKKGRLITGLVLALLFVLGLCFGTVMLNRTVNALQSMTRTAPEFSRACVYVRTEDEARSIEDLSGDLFGVLPPGLLNDTEEALSQINEGLGLSVQTREYAGLGDLLDALLAGEIRCVILNPELLAIAGELGAYDKLDEQLRIITELRIQTPDEPLPSPAPETEETEDHCFSVYVSGIDTFGDVSVKSRSDVNIIVSVNTLTHQILMITTPRDYYVPLPISNGERDKLTHAGIYGIDVSKGALEMLYDTQIDYYFRVNFTGFEKIIDAIGGIDAELEGYPGVMHLNGEEALKHARNRSAGDQWRGRNQVRIIQAAINKLLSRSVLVAFDNLLDATEGSFQTTVPYELLAGLVREQLASNPQWEILRYSVSGTGDSRVPFTTMIMDGKPMRLYVMWPDEEDVADGIEMLKAMHRDEVIQLPEDYEH